MQTVISQQQYESAYQLGIGRLVTLPAREQPGSLFNGQLSTIITLCTSYDCSDTDYVVNIIYWLPVFIWVKCQCESGILQQMAIVSQVRAYNMPVAVSYVSPLFLNPIFQSLVSYVMMYSMYICVNISIPCIKCKQTIATRLLAILLSGYVRIKIIKVPALFWCMRLIGISMHKNSA